MRTYTIKDFNKQFPTDEACLELLYKTRYPHGVFCKKCGKVTKHYKRTGMKFYSCEFCGMGVSPTTGTIFEKSDTPLRSWFHAIFLMSTTRTGISAKQLERELGVTYKTAWRMFTQIRKLMAENVNPLSGQVEVDETYIGGKHEGKRGIDGVNHHVSPLYLQGYLDTYVFRYNHRQDETPMFLSVLGRVYPIPQQV